MKFKEWAAANGFGKSVATTWAKQAWDAARPRPEDVAESIFQHIKHGDVAHQEWLRREALVWAKQYFKK